jgi:NADH-quinone oxidoreductase subunit A
VHFDFAVVLVFFLVGAAFMGGSLLLSRLLRPHLPDPLKSTVYECGERPIGGGWFNFNPRFYLIALVFLVFDVEIALSFPVAVVLRDWVLSGRATTALVEFGLFIGVLGAALAYVWRRGDLEWERNVESPKETQDAE